MVASLSEFKLIDKQFLDDLVVEVWVRRGFTLQVDVYLLEHDQVVLDLTPNSPQLFLFRHDPFNEHCLPIVAEHLTEHFW